MRGRYVVETWQSDPVLYAPPRYRRACKYKAFIPDRLAAFTLELPGTVAGIASDAEKAIADLNRTAAGELGRTLHRFAPTSHRLSRSR